MKYEFIKREINIRLVYKTLIINILDTIIRLEKRKKGKIAFVLCNDKAILKLNKTYLQHNYTTDIITFDYCEGKIVSGEIYISIDTVQRNSKLYKTDFYNELHRVIFHGVLHLCGYNDHTQKEKKRMRQKEDYYLSLMNKIA